MPEFNGGNRFPLHFRPEDVAGETILPSIHFEKFSYFLLTCSNQIALGTELGDVLSRINPGSDSVVRVKRLHSLNIIDIIGGKEPAYHLHLRLLIRDISVIDDHHDLLNPTAEVGIIR